MAIIAEYFVRKSTTNYELVSFTFEREGNESVDQTPFEVSKSNSANLDIGDDVSIGYMNGATFVPDFSGDIVTKSVNETSKYILESYGGRLNRSAHFSAIYNDTSPEAIMEDVLDNQVPTLTYASTATSGITISEFVIKDETPGEVATRLLGLLNWQQRTDNDKNYYFEPYGNTINSAKITIGSNANMNGIWNYIPGSIINSLTFKGGSAIFNTQQSFTATASQTEFVTDNKINGTIRVTDNGTEVLGGIDGSTTSLAYTIDSDNKTIVFETGRTVDHTIIVYYNYEVPVKITSENTESIAANGTFPKKITEDNITTMSDARKRVKTILATYSELSRSGSIQVKYDSNYLTGETVNVIDEYNDIDKSLVINKMTLEYPNGKKLLEVGTPKISEFAWQKGIDTRLKALEQKQDNSDRIQLYRQFKENVNVTLRQGRVKTTQSTIGNSWIVGSSTNGIVGTNTGTQGGGQQVVGSSGRVETIVSVVNPNSTMYERFNFTTYKDSANTTGDWSVATETLILDSAETARSLSIAKGETYSKATISLTSPSSTAGLILRLSADGGSNWESVTEDNIHNFTNTGTDLRWDITNNVGASWPTAWGTWGISGGGSTITLNNIKIIYE